MQKNNTLIAAGFCSLLIACGGGGGGGTPPTAGVNFPEGNDVVSGVYSIIWTPDANAGTFNIFLSNDGGMSYPSVLASDAPDEGRYDWDTTTLGDGSSYRLRITPTDADGVEQPSFESQNDINIDNSVPSTVIVAPQPGQQFGGSAARIEWTTTDSNPGTVTIELSSNDGASFDMVLADGLADDGAFDVDTTALPEGSGHRLRITPTDAGGNVGPAIASAGSWTLDNHDPEVSLLSPTGGEFVSGEFQINYTLTDTHASHVEILLSSDSGATYPDVIESNASISGGFTWDTKELPNGTQYRIRLVGYDLGGKASVASDSNQDFAIDNLILNSAVYLDEDGNGSLGAGDALRLTFNEPVSLSNPDPSAVQMQVTGDSLGTGATLQTTPNANQLDIALGTGAALRTRGEFDLSALTSGMPSSIELSPSMLADAIETANGTDAIPTGAVEIDAGFAQGGIETGNANSTAALSGDFDSDGDLDLAIARDASSGVLIRLQNALGAFPVAGAPLGNSDVNDLALADFDLDGNLDLLLGNAGADEVYLGDGLGSFTLDSQSIGTLATTALAVGDIDRDGDVDAIATHAANGVVEIYRNDGSGTLTPDGADLGTRDGTDVALGDLDGDGDLDVVLAGANGSAEDVWLNNGAGVFAVAGALPATAASALALGDLDGDGDLDAMWVEAQQAAAASNDGLGQFAALGQAFGDAAYQAIALADFDKDGDLDALLTVFEGSDEIWLNDGTGLFPRRLGQDFGSHSSVTSVVDDFDLDGDLDFFAPGSDVDDDVLWSYSMSGTFGPTDFQLGPAVDASIESTLESVALDANADSILDLLVVRDGGLQLMLGVGDGTMNAAATITGGSANEGDLLTADFDLDGDIDVIQVATGVAVNYFESDGAGALTLVPSAFGTTSAISGAIGDVDNDGDIDVFLGRVGLADLVYLNDGFGGFSLSPDLILGLNTQAVALADYDHDGDLDAFLGTSLGARIATNDGTGDFSLGLATLGIVSTSALAVSDLDRDGHLDVVAGHEAAASTVWFGDGLGGFSPGLTFAGGVVRHIAIGDVSQNGAIDVIIADATGLFSGAYFGVLGNLTSLGQGLGSTATGSQCWADFDGDGDLDLFQGLIGASDVIWTID